MFNELESWLALKAENTRRQYSRVLAEFLSLLDIERNEQGIERLRSVGQSEVNRFLNWVRARPAQKGRPALVAEKVSLSTVKHKVLIMHAIFDELISHGFITVNPFTRARRELRSVRGNDRRPHELIPFEKIRYLFSEFQFGTSAQAERDRAMLAAGFGGGLRSSEILGLRVIDVRRDMTGVILHLRNTKRQRAELQRVPKWAGEIIEKYQQVRRYEGARDIEPLFPVYRAGKATTEPILDRTFRRMFDRYMARIGLTGEYSPHCMRAAAITKLLEDGRSHRDVMRFARHSSPEMTAHYDKLRHKSADDVADDLDY